MDQCVVKPVSSLEKVFPGQEPGGQELRRLSGLRGETVSFQLAYYGGTLGGFSRGRVRVESEIAPWVRVRTVELAPCEYPCGPDADDGCITKEPGLYPDRLADLHWQAGDSAAEVALVWGQWRSLWVDVTIPEDGAAGDHSVSISLFCQDRCLGRVMVAVHVVPARLPELPIVHTEWMHSDCLANYYSVEVFSGDYWRITEKFVRTAMAHRCNMLLTPLFTPPLDTAVGGERRTVQLVGVEVRGDEYRFDFSNFRRWVAMGERCGVHWYEMSHLFTQWGAKAAPKIEGIRDGEPVRLFGWQTDAAGPEYAAFLHQFLPALRRELEALGLEKRTWFHVSDEPGMADLESYRNARSLLARELPGYPIFDALSDYGFYEQGLVSCPVCALDHMDPFLEKRQEGQPLWGYYCCAQSAAVSNRYIVHPGWRTRVLGVQLYKYRLDGFLHWGYNFYNSCQSLYPVDPYRCTDAGRAFPSGDAFLVYPGPGGEPEESLRLMLMDEAMADLCAMTLLEGLTDRQTVLDCIEPEGAGLTMARYPQNPEYLTALRERVNTRIEERIL